MDSITLEKDIKVFYVRAKSFPEGIMEAHQMLHTLIPFSKSRQYFGISRPENGVTIYKAAAEELEEGEAEKYGCETFTIKKGQYISQTIEDYAKDIKKIGITFQELLKEPNIDPNGFCLEWYFNDKDVRCMIPLRS